MHITPPTSVPPSGAAPAAPRPAAPAASATPPAMAGATLWDILTPDEREFFLRMADMGPLTYRPGATPRPAAPTGGRIDVRG